MISETNNRLGHDKKRQLTVAFVIYILYVGTISLANILMRTSLITGNEMYETIGGMLFGFISIPLLSIILPLLLAKKWNLQYSFWPKDKHWGLVAVVTLLMYFYFGFRESITIVLTSGISPTDFVVHALSASLFHIPYYPLFLVLIFPVVRKNYGLFWGILITALTFALYHLGQFHNFPEGLTVRMQLFFVAEFILILALYLWGQSVILLSLAHTLAGAFDLAANNFLSTETDFVFIIALIVSGATLAYMIWQARQDQALDPDWWPQISAHR
ncbi:MAG: hypothetical protein GY832_24215 [Chloroflexi bacterium]|nr:hypothetical protein [Chloroflexota bacterium]